MKQPLSPALVGAFVVGALALLVLGVLTFGAGSFHRHLAAEPRAVVLAHPRLAIDLDTPRDLVHARKAAGGSWLGPFLPAD